MPNTPRAVATVVKQVARTIAQQAVQPVARSAGVAARSATHHAFGNIAIGSPPAPLPVLRPFPAAARFDGGRDFSSQPAAPASQSAPPVRAAADPDRPWLPAPVPANEGWGAWLGRKADQLRNTALGNATNTGPWVHRADTRPFAEVETDEGLKASGGTASFAQYVTDNNRSSRWIGAYADHENAMAWQNERRTDRRHVYNIHPGEGAARVGENADAKLQREHSGVENPFSEAENEHVFTDKIPLHMIHSHYDLDGKLHLNPHYIPPDKRTPPLQ